MPASFVLQNERFAAYIHIISGGASGNHIYIDNSGVIHVVPTGPDDRRVADRLKGAVQKLQAAITEMEEAVRVEARN